MKKRRFSRPALAPYHSLALGAGGGAEYVENTR
jgi:hypothetical protein